MDTERLNLPSASNALADSLCPGRHLAQQGLPETESDDARYGRDIHRAMTRDYAGLSESQVEAAERAAEIEDRCVEVWRDAWRVHLGEPQYFSSVSREVRLYRYDDDLLPTNSGQVDVLWIAETLPAPGSSGIYALIGDLKSLWSEAPDPTRNLQLRDLAVLVWETFAAESVTVFINQPKLTRQPKLVTYDQSDLSRARDDMVARVRRSMDPSSPRIAGPIQCRYCRALTSCPEARKMMELETRPALELLPGELLSETLDRCEVAERLIRQIEAEAKRRLELDPESVPNYALKPGAMRRTITDPERVWQRCAVAGIKPAHFMSAVQVLPGKLEKVVKEAGYKGSQVRSAMEEFLKGCVEEKQSKPSLNRKA